MTGKTTLGQTPVIEGENATFIWRGKVPPVLAGDFNDWDIQNGLSLKKVKRNTWALTLQFRRDAYIEYAYFLDGQRVPDPANPRLIYNGIDADNHYFYMPEGAPTPLAQRCRGVPRGKVTRHVLRSSWNVVGGRRSVYLYHPPVSEACPLVLVYDGQDYKHRGSLTHIVDNLIHQGRIQPVALAMVANHRGARSVEYACNDANLAFVYETVLPLAREALNLLDVEQFPGSYGVLGASMGGLMALYTGMRLPLIFGKVLSQSGAFDSYSVIYDLLRLEETKPLKVWMDIGVYDFLHKENKQMYALLSSRGYDATCVEYSGGHSFSAWRDDVWRGLESLFRPPNRK